MSVFSEAYPNSVKMRLSEGKGTNSDFKIQVCGSLNLPFLSCLKVMKLYFNTGIDKKCSDRN